MGLEYSNEIKVSLVDSMGDDYRAVQAARVSVDDDQNTEGARRLINFLLREGHWSPFEHVQFTFHSEVPLFLARQVMRHQSHSFNEMSLRYSEAIPRVYLPSDLHRQHERRMQGRALEVHEHSEAMLWSRQHLYEKAWNNYSIEINRGVAREQAREMLPVAFYTKLWTTMNLRSLVHFLGDRDDPGAQTEAQVYAQKVRNLVRNIVPITLEEWEKIND